ncbi:MAG TPA: NAD-dependent epimerase/dehydratase family protein [Mycobacteriales bacterium]|nr:NAD-dependent epimerase/dehydratase family protein [Mycobacteriales bacterium]
MNTVVTGGCGFIGSHVVDRLVAAGHDVLVLDESIGLSSGGARYVECDVTDRDAVVRAVEGCEVVFHLAGMSNVDEAHRYPMRTVALNVVGTTAVLEAARACGVQRVVLASTVWVYGAATEGAGPLREDSPIDLARAGHLYTSTKLAAELVVHSYRELYDQHFTILRYGVPYGPRMRDELVVARFVQKALAGEPLTIAGDGSQFRNYLYVEDLADAHVAALADTAEDQVFALEGAEPISVRMLVDTVTDLVGHVEVEQVPGRPGDYTGRSVSADKAAALLGWRPTTSFREGVRRYLEWYRAQQPLAVRSAE